MAQSAEICLLGDLYRAYRDRADPLVGAGLGGDQDAAAELITLDPHRATRVRPSVRSWSRRQPGCAVGQLSVHW